MHIKIEVLKREEGYHAFASFDGGPEKNAQGATEFAAAQAAVLKLLSLPIEEVEFGPRIPEQPTLRTRRTRTPSEIREVLLHNEGEPSEVTVAYRDLTNAFSVRRVRVSHVLSHSVRVFDLDKQEPRTFRLAGIEWVEGEL